MSRQFHFISPFFVLPLSHSMNVNRISFYDQLAAEEKAQAWFVNGSVWYAGTKQKQRATAFNSTQKWPSKKKKIMATICCLLFIVRVLRSKNQMFEVEVTSLTIVHKTHIINICFLWTQKLWRSQCPSWECFFQAFDRSSDELTLSPQHQHFGLLITLNQ